MKTLYCIAVLLLVAAIVCDLTAKRYFVADMTASANALCTTQTGPGQTGMQLGHSIRVGQRFGFAGLLIALVGIASGAVSFLIGKRRQARLTPVIPTVLLALYVMLMLLMV